MAVGTAAGHRSTLIGFPLSRPAALASRFRPWLDHPGDPETWPAWQLDERERAALATALREGACLAVERLRNLYGEQADRCGAVALVETLGAAAPSEAELQCAALAVAASDYYRTRLDPPRNDWIRLRAYLVTRGLALLRGNAADSLLWRAIALRVPDDWVPMAQLTRSIQQELAASGLFGEVGVTLELNPPVAGGGRWIAMQSRAALAELRRRLAAREACLVELIRDVERSAPVGDVVVVYRLEDELTLGRDGVDRVRLWIYDPRRGGVPASLRLTLADDGVQAVEWPAGAGRPSVKALRLVLLEPAEPPVAAWRRRTPLGALWWLKRGCLLALTRHEAG